MMEHASNFPEEYSKVANVQRKVGVWAYCTTTQPAHQRTQTNLASTALLSFTFLPYCSL